MPGEGHIVIVLPSNGPKEVTVYPNMTFNGYCDRVVETYYPSFVLIVDGKVVGAPCGYCVTDYINQARKVNPDLDVKDYRYALLN